jgi:hypothetical protein
MWVDYVVRLSQWEEGGDFLVQIISTCLRCALRRGGGGRHPVVLTFFDFVDLGTGLVYPYPIPCWHSAFFAFFDVIVCIVNASVVEPEPEP